MNGWIDGSIQLSLASLHPIRHWGKVSQNEHVQTFWTFTSVALDCVKCSGSVKDIRFHELPKHCIFPGSTFLTTHRISWAGIRMRLLIILMFSGTPPISKYGDFFPHFYSGIDLFASPWHRIINTSINTLPKYIKILWYNTSYFKRLLYRRPTLWQH